MPQTVIRGTQILNNTVQRQDLDTSTVGQAVVTKIVQGTGITLSSTGADSGTGDVTVTSPDVVSTDAGNIATLGSDNHILVPQSQIWSVRLHTFQALGNNTFEVDQRNVGNAVAGIWGSPAYFLLDRWTIGTSNSATMRFTAQQQSGNVAIPGTNFFITSKFYRLTLTTAQATLAAGDYAVIQQAVEGPRLRELLGDVHSVSLLVRSSVANLKFGLYLQDNPATHTLSKLCTLGAAPNTWTLIPLQSLPLWTAAGTFPIAPGGIGYYLGIVLAAGSSLTAAANDVWQSSSAFGAIGQSNFAASPVNSSFDLAYISHEPGAQSSNPPIDCPFMQNYEDCLRYFFKTYPYSLVPGSVAFHGANATFWANTASAANGYGPFKKTMAKSPSVSVYNPQTGAINTAYNSATGAAVAISAVNYIGDSAFLQLGGSFANQNLTIHYIADTGW